MIYPVLKQVHLLCVLLSGGGFLLRGVLMMIRPMWLRHPVARVLPHLVDTVLLASALGMVAMIGWPLLTQSWLISKVILLLVYIVLGSIALKRGATLGLRVTALVLALLVFTQMLATGLLRHPGGLLIFINH